MNSIDDTEFHQFVQYMHDSKPSAIHHMLWIASMLNRIKSCDSNSESCDFHNYDFYYNQNLTSLSWLFSNLLYRNIFLYNPKITSYLKIASKFDISKPKLILKKPIIHINITLVEVTFFSHLIQVQIETYLKYKCYAPTKWSCPSPIKVTINSY